MFAPDAGGLVLAEPIIEATRAWHTTHPGAVVGVLSLRGVANPPHHPAAERAAAELEADLRARYGRLDRAALRAVPPLPAYSTYFKRFGERYHVALQIESVALKGKPIPRVDGLVAAMFVAELRHLILTAGHDADAVSLPLRLNVGTGDERFSAAGGRETAVKRGDMYCADRCGPLSAVVAGPAARARLSPETRNALFVAYAPAGVPPSQVVALLDEIEGAGRTLAGDSVAAERQLLVADGKLAMIDPAPPLAGLPA